MMTIEDLKALVRDVPDFPQKGILFKDITTMLKDKEGLRLAAQLLCERYADKGITKVVGIESRGFIMGPIVAEKVGAGFVPMRKPGKLPANTVSESYTKEYGVDTTYIVRKDTPSGVALILVDSAAQNSISVALGANNELSLEDVMPALNTIEEGDIVLLQLEIPIPTVESVIAVAAEKGARVILNPAPAAKET